MIKPPKLNPGDKVAIVSLSSGILGESFAKHQLLLGTKRLTGLGYQVEIMPNALKGMQYLDKHPEARASDLKQAFSDDSIKAIICAIGGVDTYRVVEILLNDQEFIDLVRKKPKIFTGFSDSTINHLMFYKLGLVSYYGPSFLNDFAELDQEMLPYTLNCFNQLTKVENNIPVLSSDKWYYEREDFSEQSLNTPRITKLENHGYEVLNGSGIVEGKLLGGCIESLYELISGTRFISEKTFNDQYQLFPLLSEWNDKIIFLETSEEKPNPEKLKTMLNSLKDVGIFNQVKAVMIGKPQNEVYYQEYKKVYLEVIPNLPIIYNVNFGHAYPRCILPYGLPVSIDFNNKNITILEALVEND